MKKQLLSFKYALRGIWYTVKTESHMRFHIVIAFYVLLFSSFYNFTAAQQALLILLIAAVMACEALNTCIEEICNLTADRFEPIIKAAKDTAAGAVLILSAAAVAVGIIFFWNTTVIAHIFDFFAHNIFMLVFFTLSLILSVLFVLLGPIGIKAKFLRLKIKIKKLK